MGDLQLCPEQAGVVSAALADDDPPLSPSPASTFRSVFPPSHPPNPHPSAIGASTWRQAEQATEDVIRHIQPTVVSEQRRKTVVEYVQRLIRSFLSCEVFSFGSVPLKTYLPDGDIDLTAIGIVNSDDALAADVRAVLEGEEYNKDAEFEIKDVQYIHAEVKLVKCLVQNIVVDISFNQIGGLCTLCFLEQVDRLIGKDHLFKRSIILIKAWCYYESRILGAHHGLISTYALETLVLYIFHLFHSSLYGPLAVLYRFLDYYSKFDWDNYCISLNGPVAISSLPDLSAETPDNNGGGDLLLTKEFLRSCVANFSVPARGSESNPRIFVKKHLNIVDPLRECNNLGRSVNRGNFFRIRSAFSFGARKLGQLLLLPTMRITDEVNMFFSNTMDRHGSGERPDVLNLIPRCLDGPPVESNEAAIVQTEQIGIEEVQRLSSGNLTYDDLGDLSEEVKNIRISGSIDHEGQKQSQKLPYNTEQSRKKMESSAVNDGPLVLMGDTREHSSAWASCSRNISENHRVSGSTNGSGISSFRISYHDCRDFIRDPVYSANFDSSHNNSDLPLTEEMRNSLPPGYYEPELSSGSIFLVGDHGKACQSESPRVANYTLSGSEGNHTNGGGVISNEMSDLSGDYDTHLNSLVYAKWCQEQIIGTYYLPIHQSPSYHYPRHQDVWNIDSVYTAINANAVLPASPFSPTASYPINSTFSSSTYGTEDVPKPRGTGTYFPNMNYRANRERHSHGRGKNLVSKNQVSRPENNGRIEASHDTNLLNKSTMLSTYSGSGHARPSSFNAPHSSSRLGMQKGLPQSNGLNVPLELGSLEFGSLGPLPLRAPLPALGRKLDLTNSQQGFGITNTSSLPRSAANSNKER
ncbi:DNA polymerase sigma subunit [Apostasia shenzhenica]|uniref:DNA polymerase sigma subunit n=1 Tax=Apostasia shenzhenica TaxID=1088818 RepID=A0A2I0AQ00_9ASPA|nr:DNA polymerase sigma subunit [Apostasia shenzhenica]